MELAECKHPEEKVVGIHQGQTLASCPTCGQTCRYLEGKEGTTVITKLGRIDGAIVMPPVGMSLNITPTESRLVREGLDIINRIKKPTRPEVNLLPESVKEKESEEGKEGETPPPPFGTKKPHFDKRREKILADYGQMTIVDLEKKWKMRKGYFYSLKHRWENEGITIPTAYADRTQEVKEEVAEVAMVKTPAGATSPAPKGKRLYSNIRRLPFPYWKRNCVELTADYRSMRLADFLKKWHLSTGRWIEIRDLLEIPKKSTLEEKRPRKITGRAKPVEATRVTKEATPEPFRTSPLNKRIGIRAIRRF